MRLELSRLIDKTDLTKEDIDQHFKIPFFDPSLLNRPEFRVKNKLINLNEKDIFLLTEALKGSEEEQAKIAAQAKQQNAPVAAPNAKDAKKPDPKKDQKGKPPAKGAVVVEDPNSPKEIVIDYPDVPSLPDYLIIDRSYLKMKESEKPAKVV